MKRNPDTLALAMDYAAAMEACAAFCRSPNPPKHRGRVLLINAVNEVARERAVSFLRPEHQARFPARAAHEVAHGAERGRRHARGCRDGRRLLAEGLAHPGHCGLRSVAGRRVAQPEDRDEARMPAARVVAHRTFLEERHRRAR